MQSMHGHPWYYTYPVSGLKDLKYDKDTQLFAVRVSWHGFEPEDDTYKPLQNMQEDVPDKLHAYLAGYPNQMLAERALESLL
jgi:hypothetical protein